MLSISFLQLAVLLEITVLIAFFTYRRFNPFYLLLFGFFLLIFTMFFVLALGAWGNSCEFREALYLNRIGCSPAVFGFSYALIVYGLAAGLLRWISEK